MADRDLVVVDLETTGLLVGHHVVLEVAAVNVRTGKELYFVPALPNGALDRADGDAMRINRYFERGVYESVLTPQATHEFYDQLWEMLWGSVPGGNTFGGCNPRFDAQMIMAARGDFEQKEPWHHRLAALESYAAPALHLPPTELVGLDKVCAALHVDPGVAHSALDDARATAECFRRLAERYTGKAAQGVVV